MYTFLQKLIDRSSTLGNHAKKYSRNIELYGDALVQRLEKKGLIDQVHLWKAAQSPFYEMNIISKGLKSFADLSNFLGCYYAIQILHLNLNALDILFLKLTSKEDHGSAYKELLIQTGIKFRLLNKAYMAKLLSLFLHGEKSSQIAICGVGTRVDQDDLDLGIIDDGTNEREELNIAFGRLNSEMMKWAIPLHMHLSQYVGEPGFTASIEEYKELLQREIHDFIIISEMLGARLIWGSVELFNRFEEEVTARYYYHKGGNNLYHEGYIRGIIGEVRSLQLRPSHPNRLHPKEDGLLLIRGLLHAQKTIYSIDAANSYEILDQLKRRRPAQLELFNDMEEILLFFETFRFLYQLLIIQDEEISIELLESHQNLKLVAEHMGYKGIGSVDAYDRLLTHYFEYAAMAKEKTDQVFDSVTSHLQKISAFSHLALASGSGKRIRHPARKFADLTFFFRGTKFWDDVIRTLETGDCRFLKLFAADLASLSERERARVIRRLAGICEYSFYAILSFILVIARNINKLPQKSLLDELNERLFSAVRGTADEVRRLVKVFSHYPQLLNDYLASLDIEKQGRFKAMLDTDIWEEEVKTYKAKLSCLTELYCCASHYFKRFYHKITKRYPESIHLLNEPSTLKHIAEGLLGQVERHPDHDRKKELLGDYYNLEFLRTGLELLQGAPPSYVNSEFTDFSDIYLKMLFDVCKMELEEEWSKRIASFDLLALFVTGGHGRGQAFDDDYDIIVIMNSEDRELHRYASKIMSRMNAEIIKRGILPHYRFSEYNGQYVTLMNELRTIIEDRGECNFIDKAQLLGSRCVVGSTVFEELFGKEIIRHCIFEQNSSFINDMVNELRNRHDTDPAAEFKSYNIKECRGGLRDIEMFYLILKAHFTLEQPIGANLTEKLCEMDRRRSINYEQLQQVFDNLKHLRDVYRLTVTADDTLDPSYLAIPAQILGIEKKKTESAEDTLQNMFYIWVDISNRIIHDTLADIGLE